VAVSPANLEALRLSGFDSRGTSSESGKAFGNPASYTGLYQRSETVTHPAISGAATRRLGISLKSKRDFVPHLRALLRLNESKIPRVGINPDIEMKASRARRSGRDVERISHAEHWNRDGGVRHFHYVRRYAVTFVTQN
jgi:hypothetical protein